MSRVNFELNFPTKSRAHPPTCMTMVESWTPRLVTRSIFISAISLGLRSSGLKAVARRASSSGFRKATPVLGAEEAGNAGLADAEEGDALDVDTMIYLKLGLWVC